MLRHDRLIHLLSVIAGDAFECDGMSQIFDPVYELMYFGFLKGGGMTPTISGVRSISVIDSVGTIVT